MTDRERTIIHKVSKKVGLEANIGAENEPVAVFLRKREEEDDTNEVSMLLAVYPKEFTLRGLSEGLDGFCHNRKDCECLLSVSAPLPLYLNWARKTAGELSRRLNAAARREADL